MIGEGDVNLVERAKAIVMTPAAEWRVIDREPGDAGFLFANYVAILAAIPAVCGFVGWVLAGLPIVVAFFIALSRYVMSFVTLYVAAFVVDQVAPTFGGRRDFEGALKLVVYSATPVWLAGVFLIIPPLAFLTILGLYSLYLLWIGIPILMRVPADRTLVFTVVVVLCMLVVAIVFGILFSLVIGFRAIM